MVRFQCPHCQGIIASEEWTPGDAMECAYCSQAVNMPEDRLSPSMVLGDFLLIRKLGAGGMGIVFLAHQLSLDRPAAIKVLNSEFSKEAESVQAFIREARSAAKINHPNIVQAYAVGEEDGIFYFAMELLNGDTMKEVLQEEGKIEPRRAADVIMQVAQALDCAWREQKLIHRDIKPDNIMKCADDRVKLADLGLSGTFGDDADDDSDEVVGTPQYISPEQLTGVVTDTRSDIYSLGATFYHLVTGQFPYNGENTEEIAKQHVFGTLVPPIKINPLLPARLNDIIVKMMEKKPENRYKNCADLVKDIKKFLEGGDKAGGLGGLSGAVDSLGGSSKSAGSAVTKLNSGLGTLNVQPKITPAANPAKLSIKIAETEKKDDSTEEKSDGAPIKIAPAVADNTKASEASEPPKAPAIKLGAPAKPAADPDKKDAAAAPATPAAPKITLRRAGNQPAPAAPASPAVPPAAAAVSASPATPATATTPAASPATPAAVTTPAAPVAVPKNTGAKDEKASDKSKDDAGKSDKDPIEAAKEQAEDKAEKEAAQQKKVKMLLVIGAAALVAVLIGGGAFYHIYQQKGAENASNGKPAPGKTVAELMVAANQPVVESEEADAPAVPVPEIPALPAEPELSRFMKQIKPLEEMSLHNEAGFVDAWPDQADILQPETAEERKMYEMLANSYLDIDERINVQVSRKGLLDEYNRVVAGQNENRRVQAHQARIKKYDDDATAYALLSLENYKRDLPRKMSILDHALITAGKSGSDEDWQNLAQTLQWAKGEVARVAGKEGFKPVAEVLANYAVRLEVVAVQGRMFTELLKSNSLQGKTFKGGNLTVIINGTTEKSIDISLQDADGNDLNSADVDLVEMNPAEAFRWVALVEPLLARSDQYFYYMLYHGYLRQRLAVAAPDDYWKQRVDRIARGYFKRAILLADEKQLAELKREYGEWLSFQNALKEFEGEQK